MCSTHQEGTTMERWVGLAASKPLRGSGRGPESTCMRETLAVSLHPHIYRDIHTHPQLIRHQHYMHGRNVSCIGDTELHAQATQGTQPVS